MSPESPDPAARSHVPGLAVPGRAPEPVGEGVERLLSAYPRIYFACHQRHVRDPEGGREVSAHQASILSHLDTVEPTRLGELADHMGVTSSTMSLAVKRLERDGYVRRARDPDDGRVVLLRLTEAGRRMREAQSVLEPALVAALLEALEPHLREEALRGLEILAQAADAVVRGGVEPDAREEGAA